MSAFGIKVVSIVVSNLVDDIFYSDMELEMAGRHVRVDARPSDAIAIAVRARTPIYIEDSVLERAGVSLEAHDSDERNDAQIHERDRFDKFTERARKVLSLAQEEAQRFQHNYIGTEHLLLSLAREGESVAGKVLKSLGVDLEKVLKAVEDIISRGDRIVLGEIGLTPRAKKVIELAEDEARLLDHHYIGTEHLLLRLLREGEGRGAEVLKRMGVNLEKMRAATLRVLSEEGEESGQQQSQNDKERLTQIPGSELTEREREVLTLIARGYTSKQIADTLFVSEKTVRNHVSHILDKLGLSRHSEAKESYQSPDEESSASSGQPIQDDGDTPSSGWQAEPLAGLRKSDFILRVQLPPVAQANQSHLAA